MNQPSPARGHFVSWNGGCLFIGRAGGLIGVHAHYAIQVAFGSEPGIRFRSNEREEWSEYGGVIIPSRQPHAMDATVVPQNVVIFVEPETHEGRALTELYSLSGITSLPNDAVTKAAAVLFSVYRDQRTAPALIDAARQVIRELTHGVDPSVVSDERILRATAYIQRHLGEPLTLEQVAREVFLSPSRFRHLFVEQTGLALRPSILWRRFLRVWELLMARESLSSAAHTAGFADAAHLTRTSRRMFGFPPSAMLMAGPLPGQQPHDSPNAKSQPIRSTG